MYPSSLWGPSLDQLDHVVERCLLPELSVGDWLLFSNMGACGLDEVRSLQLPVYYAVSTSDWCVPSRATLPTQAEGFVGTELNPKSRLVSSAGSTCRRPAWPWTAPSRTSARWRAVRSSSLPAARPSRTSSTSRLPPTV